MSSLKAKKTYKLKKQACKKNIKNVQMTVLGFVKLQIQCSVDFVIKWIIKLEETGSRIESKKSKEY